MVLPGTIPTVRTPYLTVIFDTGIILTPVLTTLYDTNLPLSLGSFSSLKYYDIGWSIYWLKAGTSVLLWSKYTFVSLNPSSDVIALK